MNDSNITSSKQEDESLEVVERTEDTNKENLEEADGHKEETKYRVVDGGWGWVVVFGSGMVHFFLIGIARSLGIIFLLLKDKFETSSGQTALAMAIFICIRSLGCPVASSLSDRFGCRKVTVFGGLLLFVGITTSAFATNIIFVFISFGVVAGVGAMLIYTPCYIIINYWFDKNRGKAMSFSSIGTGLGSIVMAHALAAMAAHYQYFGSMLLVGALMLNNCVGGCLFLNPPKNKPTREDVAKLKEKLRLQENCTSSPQGAISSIESKELDEADALDSLKQIESSCDKKLSQEIKQNDINSNEMEEVCKIEVDSNKSKKSKSCDCSIWCNFPFMVHCFMMIGQQGCIQSLLVFLPSYARQELGVGPTAEAWILTVFGIADLIGRFVFGFVFDLKWVRPRRVVTYIVISVLFALFGISAALTSNYAGLVVITAAAAFFEGGAHSQRATVIPNYVESSQVSAGVGVVFLFMGIGNFYAPVVGGALGDYTQTFRSSFALGGSVYLVICLVNILQGLILWKRNKLQKPSSDVEDEKVRRFTRALSINE